MTPAMYKLLVALMVLFIIALLLVASLLAGTASCLKCVGIDGERDWYIALKSAGQGRHTSSAYAYVDSEMCDPFGPLLCGAA